MFEEDSNSLPMDAILKRPKVVEKKTVKPAARTVEPEKAEVLRTNQSPSAKRFDFMQTEKLRKRKSRRIWTIITIILLAAVGAGVFWVLTIGSRIFEGKSPLDILRGFGKLATSDDRPLLGEDEGNVNILLLGIGGEGHQGGTLADTIIVATIRPEQEGKPAEASLVSIPRDFVVELPDGYEWRKINSAYAYGELKEEGLGAKWTLNAVEEWSGLTIPYYAVIDFVGFEGVIDELSGIDIEIERSFTDSQFPDNEFGYLPTLRFDQGIEHMGGTRALQFARSRHGTNGEGGDFARAARQQKVLLAVRERVSELKISTNLSTIAGLLNTFSKNFKTNLEPWEIRRLYDLIKNISPDSAESLALDYDTGLICPEIVEETQASILTLCSGKTKTDVHRFFSNRFGNSTSAEEKPTILFQNATRVNFLAATVAEIITVPGATKSTSNFPGSNIPTQTIIHDLTNGQKPESLASLSKELPGSTIISGSYPYPDQLPTSTPDFVVVLGTDAAEQFGN